MLEDTGVVAEAPLSRWLAMHRATLTRAYSDDQPRDDHGRWTSGGDSGTDPAEYFSHTERLSNKSEVVGARMAQDPELRAAVRNGDYKEFLDEVEQEDGKARAESFVDTFVERQAQSAADRIRQNWVTTSADSNAHSLALQLAIQKEFGLDDAATDHLNSGVLNQARSMLGDPKTGPEIRSFVRATYAETQDQLREAGITHLTLQRGMWLPEGQAHEYGVPADGSTTTDVKLQPLSSFTTDERTAAQFTKRDAPAGSAGFTLETRVPASRIFSTPLSGPGDYDQREVLVLGGDLRAKVTAVPKRTWAAVADLAKYSPDQPRDDHGRFGSGGSFSPASTQAEALTWASNHGLHEVSADRAPLQVQNYVHEAVTGLLAGGVKTEDLPTVDYSRGQEAYDPHVLMQYNPKDHSISVFGDSPDWKDLPEMSKNLWKTGWWASPNELGALQHEFGHALHGVNAGPNAVSHGMDLDPSKFAQSQGYGELPDVADRVSLYATTNLSEFVAEVHAGVLSGKTYDSDIMDTYRAAGGYDVKVPDGARPPTVTGPTQHVGTLPNGTPVHVDGTFRTPSGLGYLVRGPGSKPGTVSIQRPGQSSAQDAELKDLSWQMEYHPPRQKAAVANLIKADTLGAATQHAQQRDQALDPIVASTTACLAKRAADLKAGRLTATEANAAMQQCLRGGYVKATQAAVDHGGEDLPDGDAEDLVNQHVEQQKGFLGGLVADVIAARDQADAHLGLRLMLYASTAIAIYEQVRALVTAKGDDQRTFTWHAMGDEDECELCQGRDGEEYTLQELQDSGMFPGAGDFGEFCAGGPNCRCVLVLSEDSADNAGSADDGSSDDVGDDSDVEDAIAAAAVADLAKFNDDQPRDDHGRWTSGGGSGLGRQVATAADGTPIHIGSRVEHQLMLGREFEVTAGSRTGFTVRSVDTPSLEIPMQLSDAKNFRVTQAVPDAAVRAASERQAAGELGQQRLASTSFEQTELYKQALSQPPDQLEAWVRGLKDDGNSNVPLLGLIAKEYGATGKPDVISDDQLQQYVADGETEYFRGLAGENAPAYAEQYRSGAYFAGYGPAGNGTYVAHGSNGYAMASEYAGNDGAVLHGTIRASANVVPLDDVVSQMKDQFKELDDAARIAGPGSPEERRAAVTKALLSDPGAWAIAHGIDAIGGGSISGVSIVLNRSMARVVGGDVRPQHSHVHWVA